MEEKQYLDAIRMILECGFKKEGRNGGTTSLPGMMMRYSLSNGTLPMFTTKRVFWKGVREELLWFIKGSTSARDLAEHGVHIWDDNASREFLDSRGLNYEEGDLGPIYGFQWRHWGAEYNGSAHDYKGQGIDQLDNVIRLLKTDPYNRRILLSAWNVNDLDKMALPPCHSFAQFLVHEDKLTCVMYQRSADMGLGVPFNVTSYSLLTHMIAHVTGLTPFLLIHMIGDAHIYNEHIESLNEQLTRELRPFPTLVIQRRVESMDDFKSEDLCVNGYNPHPPIVMKMIV